MFRMLPTALNTGAAGSGISISTVIIPFSRKVCKSEPLVQVVSKSGHCAKEVYATKELLSALKLIERCNKYHGISPSFNLRQG